MKNEITIPEEILEEAGFTENDLLEFYVDNHGRIIVQRVLPEDRQTLICEKGEAAV